MIPLIDWWRLERPAFDGAACLADAAGENTADASTRAIVRLFILQLGAASLREARPIGLDGVAAASYLAALLAIDDPEAGPLWRALAAVRADDVQALAEALNESARMSAARYAPQTARKFAELSYEAALACGSWVDAHAAAVILTRLAELDECPAAAERWERRSEVHARRVRRGRGRR